MLTLINQARQGETKMRQKMRLFNKKFMRIMVKNPNEFIIEKFDEKILISCILDVYQERLSDKQ